VRGIKDQVCANGLFVNWGYILNSREEFVSHVTQKVFQNVADPEILEIGPYMSPLLSEVEFDTFDVLTHEQLLKRAIEEGGPGYLIPAVTWVGPRASAEYIHKSYDLVLSSHVVEHQTDLVRHFQDIGNLLNPGGLYAALIPDHRYCYDYFNTPSKVSDVLAAYWSKPTNHTFINFLEDRLTTGHNNTLDYWKDSPGIPKWKAMEWPEVEKLVNAYLEFTDSGKYLDVHSWKFTNETFSDILSTLVRWRLVPLEISEIFPTRYPNNEFWVILTKSSI
jgi:SAM-dependent methyltransferase